MKAMRRTRRAALNIMGIDQKWTQKLPHLLFEMAKPTPSFQRNSIYIT
jgi:hypothetical protein